MTSRHKPPVMCLDGPSGSGKGTVGQLCARRLGWKYLDSGAIYRALAFSLRKAGIAAGDVDAAVRHARQLQVVCVPDPDGAAKIIVNGEDTGQQLRTEEIGSLASQLAAEPPVREAVLAAQRRARRPPGLVADGRDMGTTVFPDATLKIFLTASPEIRAQRRYKQLKLKGFDVNLAHLFQVIQDRDARDAQRSASPLVPADDAVTLDTSDLEITEVVSRVLDLLQPRLVHARAERTGTTSASGGGDSRD